MSNITISDLFFSSLTDEMKELKNITLSDLHLSCLVETRELDFAEIVSRYPQYITADIIQSNC